MVINIDPSEEDHKTIKMAATIMEQNLKQFVLTATMNRANAVLRQYRDDLVETCPNCNMVKQ